MGYRARDSRAPGIPGLGSAGDIDSGSGSLGVKGLKAPVPSGQLSGQVHKAGLSLTVGSGFIPGPHKLPEEPDEQ